MRQERGRARYHTLLAFAIASRRVAALMLLTLLAVVSTY
jgi:hypothetical protein